MQIDHVVVLGAGAWGTALAQAAALAGRRVTLCGRDPAVLADINAAHRNRRYLGEVTLSEAITAVADVPPGDLVIVAVPAQQTRSALRAVAQHLRGRPVVLSAKGLEQGTLKRQSEILAETVPEATPFVLSGPSFAHDVAAGRPTAVTLAGADEDQAFAVAAALAGPTFRPYAAGDIIGVELAGALKNIYALGCGAVEGAGLGASARSALLARAFAELSRFVAALGGSPATLTGLAGLGDLTLSCTSPDSRNYRYGMSLGAGLPPGLALAEGVATAPVAQRLAEQLSIDAPLVHAVNLLLAGRSSIGEIVSGLMTRPLKRED